MLYLQNLPDDIINNILNKLNFKCRTCFRDINNLNLLINSIIYHKYLYCSKNCFNYI